MPEKLSRAHFTNLIKSSRVLTIGLIILGLGLVFFYGSRTIESYRQVRYIQAQGLDTGDADADAIRPWMTIQFVAAAYAVPEEFIYAELGIDLPRRRRNIDVRRLNEGLRLGRSANGPYPAVIDRLQEIILAYRANPVTTGLADIRPWMTLQYVANGTGVAAETIIAELGLNTMAQEDANNGNMNSSNVNVYQPLNELAGDLRYPRGPRALMDDIEDLIEQHGEVGQ